METTSTGSIKQENLNFIENNITTESNMAFLAQFTCNVASMPFSHFYFILRRFSYMEHFFTGIEKYFLLPFWSYFLHLQDFPYWKRKKNTPHSYGLFYPTLHILAKRSQKQFLVTCQSPTITRVLSHLV